MPEIILSVVSMLASLVALAVAIHRKRKPSLAAAVSRGVAFAQAMSKDPAEKLRIACAAVQREDLADGKRNWPDATIRFEVEALIESSK